MQNRFLKHEKYNFVKYELNRIASLWGMLDKHHQEKTELKEISLAEMVKNIFLEIKHCAFKPMILVLVLAVVHGFLMGIMPYTQMLYMGALPEVLTGTTKAIITFALFLGLNEVCKYLMNICMMFWNFARQKVEDIYVNHLEAQDYVEVLHKPRALFVINSPSALLSYASRVRMNKRMISSEMWRFVGKVVSLIVATVSLLCVVPELALFLVFLFFIETEFSCYNNRYYRKVNERFQLFSQRVSRELGQFLSCAALVQTANRVEKESKHVYRRLKANSDLCRKKENNKSLSEDVFRIIINALMAVVVGYVAVVDIINTGDIGRLALISGAAFRVRIDWDLLFSAYFRMLDYKNQIVDTKKRLIEPKALARVVGKQKLVADDKTICFDKVDFSYPIIKRFEENGYNDEVVLRGEKVLSGVSATIESGGVTVIAGMSGQGKSTLMSLVRHDYDVVSGDIFIGTKNVKELPDSEINRQIAFIDQRVEFFDTTIRRNLMYMNANANEKEINDALEAAGLTEDIAKFAAGLDHKVGVNGNRLSGGQRQRLALARLFLTQSPIVIMDEPTTGLDQVLSFKVMKALKELAKKKTVVLVTHNPTEIALADKVMVIKNGKIAASGAPLELVEKSDFLSSAMTKQDVLSKQKLFSRQFDDAA